LVPYFSHEGTNLNFVQSLNDEYVIESFAEYDIGSLPDTNLIAAKYPLEKDVGAEGIVAVSFNAPAVLFGTYREINQLLGREISAADWPPFFQLEAARFLNDEVAVERAAAAASSCFADPERALRWRQREMLPNRSPAKRSVSSRDVFDDFAVGTQNEFARAKAPLARDVLDSDERGVSALLDPRFTFENFVVGKPNEFAHAAARRVADGAVADNLDPPFNPLFLHGGVGLGKTHLLHAVAWEIRRQRPTRRLIYLSAEKFMYQFVRAIRSKDTMPFKELFRSVDVLLIDDFQFIGGKESTQEEFFHTFNALVDLNRQIVISADKSPSDLDIEERMRSRLVHGMVADVHPTTYELRLVILQSKAEQLRVAIPPKVLEFLAHKIASNVRELEGALNHITAHAQFIGRDITVDSAEEVLHDLLRKNDRRVTIDEIQKLVAEHYNIRSADMHSARRAREIARPRQVAMYLCKMLTPRSLPEIGKKFGGRDQTTVLHGVRRIEELLGTDMALVKDLEVLTRLLQASEKN
jgi:chromosomal replication initiator protein